VGKKIRVDWYLYGKEKFFIGLTIGPTKIGPCLGPALWAEVAAQALSTHRVVPALGTIDRASCRARAVLFRVVPRASHRVCPIWNSIDNTDLLDQALLLHAGEAFEELQAENAA
jgi:hypothetical protein